MMPIQVGHQIRYAYGGGWKPGKVNTPRILINPDIDKTHARDISIKYVKVIQGCAGLDVFYI
jgi:hypothetical protein